MRFDSEDQRTRKVTRKGRTPCLLSGFLRCAACGSPMHGHRPRPGGSVGEYVCGARISSPGECHEPSCSLRSAEEAVLREVSRLQRTWPWSPQPVDDLHDTDTAADRAETERAIAAKRRELDRNAEIIQRMESVDQEALESFRRTARKTGDEIRALEAHLAELPDEEADAVSAQELHAMLAQTEIADIIARAWVDGDVAALRELLAATVESARIVQRVPTGTGPDRRKRWMRAEVTWTRAVDLFRKHGRLVLGPAPEPPPAQALTPRQRAAERARRYRQRKREQRAADSG